MSTQTLSTKPRDVRESIRSGTWRGVTSGMAPGYVQANLAILPQELAFDFLLFCQRNPKPCPVLEVMEPGRMEPVLTAPGADIRTDIPGYRVYEDGRLVAEVDSLLSYWRDDLVSFLLGCSFSFETAMVDAGIPLRHQDNGTNVAMYITNIATTPAGVFSGPMVVSMRPIKREQIVRAVQVTSRFPATHGAPVHIGDPAAIGISDLDNPDFGDPVEVRAGEEPVFWACGVTPQAVALNCKPSLMITHAPGRMFITDQRDADYAVI
ncbi:MAG: putative hydro-lyase [Chloroflexi bacterium]|nr:putative hydro-lyase [Chloroflexota bacterium]